jgi:hypothetical protein
MFWMGWGSGNMSAVIANMLILTPTTFENSAPTAEVAVLAEAVVLAVALAVAPEEEVPVAAEVVEALAEVVVDQAGNLSSTLDTFQLN